MKISQKNIRNFVVLFCIILALFLVGCFSKTAVTPPPPEQPTFTHYRVVTQAYKDSNPAHSIEIAWRANSIDYSFKIFKSLNGGSFEELFDDGVEQSSCYQRKSCSCSFTDVQVQPGNQYSYYILAYDDKGEVGKTETFSREIFLPPCTLKEPQNNAVVNTPIPTFSWDNKELTKYLTKSKAEGYLKTQIKVNDETVQEEVWNMTMEDTTVDNVTYNFDSTGELLENEHEYEWFHRIDAYDAEGNLIANAYSNSWRFRYRGPIKAILIGKIMVPETAITRSMDITGLIPLVGATVTFTDSEGTVHTATTDAQGQYIFYMVAPGTNYVITAVGTVDQQEVVYKDVVPSIELYEAYDAGIADAESTALAMVMEAMLAADLNLKPEDIVLDDILNASTFTSLVSTVDLVLNAYGDVTIDTGVIDAVQIIEYEVTGDPFYFEAGSHVHRSLEGELEYYTHVAWNEIPNASDYQIYKKTGSDEFMPITGLYAEYNEEINRWDAWEEGVDPGLIYEYYIEAITPTGDISCPPETVDTWFPAATVLSPVMNSIVTNPTPTFTWQSLGITFPYPSPDGKVKSGKILIRVTDETLGDIVWLTELYDFSLTSISYNSSIPLEEGHQYTYYIRYIGNDGIDLNGKDIAYSSSHKMFYYGYKPWIVYYNAETTSPEEAVLGIRWNDCTNADDYKIYKSIDNTTFDELTEDYTFRDGWYRFHDFDVTLGDTYYYKVEAYNNTNLINTSEVMIVNTWLPGITALSPINNEVVIASNPTFSWYYELTLDFPYGTFDFVGGGLIVEDVTIDEIVWDIDLDDLNTSSITYAGSPLTEGHRYYWERWISSRNEEGNICTTNTDGSFYYGYRPLEIEARTWVDKYPGDPTEYATRFYLEYPNVDSVNVYRYDGISDNKSEFSLITDQFEFKSEEESFEFWDWSVTQGNIYSYYIVADFSDGTTEESEIITLDSWFSEFDIQDPAHGSVVTDNGSSLIFRWNTPTMLSPNSIEGGDINIYFYDDTDDVRFWRHTIEDLTITEIEYGGTPLLDGHQYFLHIVYDGDNAEGEEIANSSSRSVFHYGFQPLNIEVFTWTGQDEGYVQYGVRLNWEEYPGASSYQIIRSIGNSIPGPIEVFIVEEDGEFEADDLDLNVVNPGLQTESYAYYVCAYDDSDQEIACSETKVRDTWLPPTSCISPYDYYETIESGLPYSPVNNPVQLFTWDPINITLPYGSVQFGFSNFKVDDHTEGVEERGWRIEFENDFQISHVNYNCDGLAPALQPGHIYRWNIGAFGFDENEEKIAECDDKGYYFYYQEIPWEVNIAAGTHTDLHSGHYVEVTWNNFTGANNYKVWKSENNGGFTKLLDNYEENESWYWLNDWDVAEGNTYDYYVVALDGETVIQTSPTMTVDTWLPAILPVTPLQGDLVTVPNPVFEWDYEDLIDFPYNGEFEYNGGGFNLNDIDTGVCVWEIEADENVFSITYDGPALIEGHEYQWGRWLEGENENVGIFSVCNGGGFYYGYQPFIAEASSITGSFGDHQMEVSWPIYQDASDYKVFRSTNEGSYDMIFDSYGVTPDFYDNTIDWWIDQGVDFSFHTNNLNIYCFIDFTVIEDNSYSYYVVAYGENLQEEISSNETIAINTWLPACWLVAPANGSIISDLHPLLEWSPPGISNFPFFQIYNGQMRLEVADLTVNEEVWDVNFYDLVTSSIIYDGKPLVAGHSYIWKWYPMGFDQDGHFIAEAIGGTYQFTYQYSTNKIFLQSGGTLNGTLIDPANPTLTVNSGGSITGSLNVQAIYSGPPNNVVPFGYTPSWGSHSVSYETIDGWIPVGASNYTEPINLAAPNDAGTYYLIFATNCEMELGWTMSQTNWTTETMSWDDGNDIADLVESELQSSLSTGYLYLDMLLKDAYRSTTYGIAYVKIIVTE